MSPPCPDAWELERFVEGELDREASARLEAHSSICDICREAVADVRANLGLVTSVRSAMGRMREAPAAETAPPPESVGAYRILREIGRGGMGVVYEAEQPNPRRAVAVKVLHPALGVDGRIQQMFRREAHALGRLRHPAIAAIHEAGQAADGRTFLAMELVAGMPLTEFARQRNLDIGDRMRLFQQVCSAIAYAHQRGVIHRDLKPSNILVDPGGSPKILDFGLARILDPDDSTPAVTSPHEEGRIQGTLPYMSPEQVRGGAGAIDVRSDVYSLGVVLYELLTGRLPYPIERGRLAEAARTICEEPPAPLSRVDRRLAGDIETIVLKSLEKDPDRRYAGAAAFAEDIERHLGKQPILARAPTLVYQVRKLIARHRVPAALAGAMAALVVGFAIAMGLLYAQAKDNLERAQTAEVRAEEEADRARYESEVANQIKDFLVGVFRLSDPDVAQGRSITARELLDAAARRIRVDAAHEPLVRAALMDTMGNVYQSLGMYDESAGLLREALAIRQQLIPMSRRTAETASTLAEVSRRTGDLDGAEAGYRAALEIIRAQGGDDLHVSMMIQALAEVQQERGNLPAAEATLRDMLESVRRLPRGRATLPVCLNRLAGVLADQGKYDEAVPLMREAIDILVSDGHGDMSSVTSLKGNLAWLLAKSGRNDEAEPLIREVLAVRRRILPASHPALATSLITLGVIRLNREDPAAAEPLLREAVEIRRKALAADRPDLAEAYGLLGECLARLGHYEESERLLLTSRSAFESSPHATAEERAQAQRRLNALYQLSGRSAMDAPPANGHDPRN